MVYFQESGWVFHRGIKNLVFIQYKKRPGLIQPFSLPGSRACGFHFLMAKNPHT